MKNVAVAFTTILTLSGASQAADKIALICPAFIRKGSWIALPDRRHFARHELRHHLLQAC